MSRNTAGVPFKNPVRYTGPGDNITPVVKYPKAPTILDKNHNLMTFWIIAENPTTGTEGDLWYLSEFEAGDAIWRQFDVGSGGPGVDFLRDQVNAQVGPDGSGNIDIDGVTVANAANPSAIPVETVVGTNKIDVQVQVGAAITGAPADKNDAGLSSFNDAMFTVTEHGYVSLNGGGIAVDQIDVDFATGPGVDPVLPSGTGQVSVFGNTVTNATNANAPVATHSRAVNQLHVDVQLAAAVASAADPYDAGLASFKSTDFDVSANGFVSLASAPVAQEAQNIGIAYNGGTGVFTVQGSSATLSVSNPGNITLQSKATPGHLVTIPVTADQTFIDDVGASEIINNLFGLTTAVAYASDVPFFLYAVSNDDEDTIAFMISRVPHAKLSPVVGSIGAPDDAVADTQGAFFSLENIDETLYDENPCMCVGAFRMQMSASDDWTVQTLTNKDGIGNYHEETVFIVLRGTFGSTTNSYHPASGTRPTYSNDGMLYTLSKSGMMSLAWTGVVNNTPSGAAAGITIALPFASGSFGYNFSNFYLSTASTKHCVLCTNNSGSSALSGFYIDGGSALLINNSFANGYVFGGYFSTSVGLS